MNKLFEVPSVPKGLKDSPEEQAYHWSPRTCSAAISGAQCSSVLAGYTSPRLPESHTKLKLALALMESPPK